jgi:hypothetical protein
LYKLDSDEQRSARLWAAYLGRKSYNSDPSVNNGKTLANHIYHWQRERLQKRRREMSPVTCSWRQPKVLHAIVTDDNPIDSYLPASLPNAERLAEVRSLLDYLPELQAYSVRMQLAGFSWREIEVTYRKETGIRHHFSWWREWFRLGVIELRKMTNSGMLSPVRIEREIWECECGEEIGNSNGGGKCQACKNDRVPVNQTRIGGL